MISPPKKSLSRSEGTSTRPAIVRVSPKAQDDSYTITIARGLLPQIPALIETVRRRKGLKIHRLAIITDSNLKKIYGERLASMFNNKFSIFHVPAGEASKCREMKNLLEDRLVAAKFGRDSAIIAFGGGVIGDLAGFVSATYYRGIPYFQVPTTIIAQVDSSIGGKTAIDLPSGKNLIGSFFQPRGVFMDVDLLDTLPDDEFVNGMAEVVKHAMIRDKNFFDFLERNVSSVLARDKKKLTEMLKWSCKIKAGVVSEDLRESNLRKILNFGHTVGHAVETLSNYTLHHGKSVSIGMVAEGYISFKAGYLLEEEYLRLSRLIEKFGLPVRLPQNSRPDKILKIMGFDKKNERGVVHYTLPSSIGEMKKLKGKYGLPVDMSIAKKALEELAGND